MRVIGGKFKSRKLKFPRSKAIRPATDRLKETIFDTLGGNLSGLTVLDLYAGMGSIGIEALSRGAEKSTFVDQSPLAIRFIHENLNALGLTAQAEVLKMDSLRSIPYLAARQKKPQPFHIIFIDPPYNQGLVKKTLLTISQFDILSPHGVIVIEHTRQEELPSLKSFVAERTNKYGITCLSFLHKR